MLRTSHAYPAVLALALLLSGCGENDPSPPERHVALDGQSNFRDLDEAVSRWGSMDAYLHSGLGLGDDEITRLRDEELE